MEESIEEPVPKQYMSREKSKKSNQGTVGMTPNENSLMNDFQDGYEKLLSSTQNTATLKDAFDQEKRRLTKANLVPPNNQYHRDRSLNEFISNRFDRYHREYGEFF